MKSKRLLMDVSSFYQIVVWVTLVYFRQYGISDNSAMIVKNMKMDISYNVSRIPYDFEYRSNRDRQISFLQGDGFFWNTTKKNKFPCYTK